MFWKVNISAREKDMAELCHALAGFFAYAANWPGNALDRDDFQAAQPDNSGWLLDQFEGTEKNRNDLKKAVKELFQLPQARRQAVAEAVAHDMDFDQSDDPAQFYFQTPGLEAGERNIVKTFFQYFYNPSFGRSTPPRLNGHDCLATRAELIEDYFQVNKALRNACPACLQRKYIAGEEDELDHYFPQSIYPVLSVHPRNLTFLCKDCNQRYKGQKDVLREGRKALSTVFRPYEDTVRERTSVAFQWDPDRVRDQVSLVPKDNSAGERERLASFSELFQLEWRWSGGLEGFYERLRQRYSGRNLSKDQLREKLEEKSWELEREAEVSPSEFLEAEYTAWLCEEQLDAFYESLT